METRHNNQNAAQHAAGNARLKVERVADLTRFRERAEPYLVRDEARHNLLLGILTTLTFTPNAYSTDPPYLALVTRDGEIEGVALRTPPFSLVLSEMAHPSAVDTLVAALPEENMAIPGVVAPVPVAEQFAAAWQTRTGHAMQRQMRHGVYQLRRVIPPPQVDGSARRARPEDRDLLIAWITDFGDEIGDPVVRNRVERDVERRFGEGNAGYWLWEVGGNPVSLTGYGGFTPHGARIGPVYTPREHRGHGYASALVARVSQEMLDAGRTFCFLYTDLANPTSNSIYRKIGYEWVCESEHWRTIE